MAEWAWSGMGANGKRSAWRLKVHVTDPANADNAALFAWLKHHVVPACLAAPFRVTLELVPPEDDTRARDDYPG